MDKSTGKEKSMRFLYEASLTPLKCIELIERNIPLQENLFNIFNFILKKLLFLLNKSEGIHFFINPKTDEIHYIYSKYYPNTDQLEPSEKKYVSIKGKNIKKWFEQIGVFAINKEDPPKIKNISDKSLKSLFEKIGLSVIVDEKQKAMIVPFNLGEINLGTFIIWGERNAEKKYEVFEDNILPWISSWYRFFSKFFAKEYKVDGQTYLPSYFTSVWKQVAILFADIRNFTPLTEILRNRYSNNNDGNRSLLRKIINEFCSKMCEIVKDNGMGRIDKFMGDEIMVIFGEDGGHPSKTVCEAIYVGLEMVETFNELKKGWQVEAFGPEFEIEFNESVEIDLGIGINFGHVFFDYLGKDIYQEYTAVGDHVNFASRLQGMAAREDDKTLEKDPHIIISSTAFRCSKPWLKEYKELKLDVKGKSYKYKCYGIEPENFNKKFFKKCKKKKGNDWKSFWISDDLDPPYVPPDSQDSDT